LLLSIIGGKSIGEQLDGTDIVMYCYNVNNRKSFESLATKWLPLTIATGIAPSAAKKIAEATPTPSSSSSTPIDGDDAGEEIVPKTSSGSALNRDWVRILVGLQPDATPAYIPLSFSPHRYGICFA
jgi:hypothetical protein